MHTGRLERERENMKERSEWRIQQLQLAYKVVPGPLGFAWYFNSLETQICLNFTVVGAQFCLEFW